MTDSVPETPAEGDAQAPAPKRFLFLRRRDPEPTADASADGAEAAAGPQADGEARPDRIRPGVLKRRRRQLTSQYEQGIFDLGGLAMELHARGLLAEDVMRRRAAEVADVRAQIEDLGVQLDQLREDRRERRQAGRGGSIQCTGCGFRSRATANYCASCGAPLKPEAAPPTPAADQPTTVIAGEQVTTVIADDDPQPTAVIPPQGRSGT